MGIGINWSILQGENRPTCSVPGCNDHAVKTTTKKGMKVWRRANWIKEKYPDAIDIWCCTYHHANNIAEKHGVKTSKHLTASRAGLSLIRYKNSRHKYLQYRKDYCENIDGRFGYTCNTILPTQAMINAAGLCDWEPISFLQVDHIDGDPRNNNPNNLQTLCHTCHTIKTHVCQDYKSPGRKALGLIK